jgi:hypothetical protein
MADLTDDDRRVIRFALAEFAGRQRAQLDEFDRINALRDYTPQTQPLAGLRRQVERDEAQARRLISEHFQPAGEGRS